MQQRLAASIFTFRSILDCLNARCDALESKFGLIETHMQQLNASVNVYRALGGGWK